VLRALAQDPARWRYGYELGVEIRLPSGSLYPILVRLSERDLLEASWEPEPPAGRPRRHLYRLTSLGLEYAQQHLRAPDPLPATRTRPVLGGVS
jgi:PadR family transcriptional regulator, regulatory protein PadR